MTVINAGWGTTINPSLSVVIGHTGSGPGLTVISAQNEDEPVGWGTRLPRNGSGGRSANHPTVMIPGGTKRCLFGALDGGMRFSQSRERTREGSQRTAERGVKRYAPPRLAVVQCSTLRAEPPGAAAERRYHGRE